MFEDAGHLTAPIDAIERSARLLLGTVVHRADPEGAVGTDLSVVQAMPGGFAWDLCDDVQALAFRIEDGDRALERHDQSAAGPESDGADDSRHRPGAVLRAVEAYGVNGRCLDVDEEQDLAAIVPDGALADPAAHVLEQAEFEHHRASCPAEAASAIA
jgi:hypothetical protein